MAYRISYIKAYDDVTGEMRSRRWVVYGEFVSVEAANSSMEHYKRMYPTYVFRVEQVS